MTPETIYEALIEAVKACGGTKVVAPRLWGESRNNDDLILKAKKLATCLNPERNEKLSLDEVVQIMRMARERGHHGVMTFLSAELGYAPPQPIEPRDELADLLRQVLAYRELEAKRNERLDQLIAQHFGGRVTP